MIVREKKRLLWSAFVSFGVIPSRNTTARRRLPREIEKQATLKLGELVSELEVAFGHRRNNFNIVNVMQCDDGPCLEMVGADVTVFVGPNATKYEPTLVANLAHESVHFYFLNTTIDNASGLEEGLAVDFELAVIGRCYGPEEIKNFERCMPRSYAQALQDYRNLLTFDSSAILRIQEKFGALTGPSATDLRALFPSLSRRLAFRLARRKRMRPGQ